MPSENPDALNDPFFHEKIYPYGKNFIHFVP